MHILRAPTLQGFNPIFQKFCKMICEIIVCKLVRGIFLIFCQSSFLNSFIGKSNFLEPKNYWNLIISRPIHLEKISAHRFEDNICTNNLEEFFFFEKNFFKDLELFSRLQNHWFGPYFFLQKNFILFSSVAI